MELTPASAHPHGPRADAPDLSPSPSAALVRRRPRQPHTDLQALPVDRGRRSHWKPRVLGRSWLLAPTRSAARRQSRSGARATPTPRDVGGSSRPSSPRGSRTSRSRWSELRAAGPPPRSSATSPSSRTTATAGGGGSTAHLRRRRCAARGSCRAAPSASSIGCSWRAPATGITAGTAARCGSRTDASPSSTTQGVCSRRPTCAAACRRRRRGLHHAAPGDLSAGGPSPQAGADRPPWPDRRVPADAVTLRYPEDVHPVDNEYAEESDYGLVGCLHEESPRRARRRTASSSSTSASTSCSAQRATRSAKRGWSASTRRRASPPTARPTPGGPRGPPAGLVGCERPLKLDLPTG